MRQIVSTAAAFVLVLLASGGVIAELHAQSPARKAAASAPGAAADAAAQAATGPIINLNTATAQDLESLPGIGAKTAARIIDYRQKKGPFKKVEELMNVQGIGEKSFLKLKPRISVGAGGQ